MGQFINPDQVFFDNSTGRPVANGTAYFGQPNQDPETNEKQPYSDVNLTTAIPATQALTAAGKLAQRTYLNGEYSLRVRDSSSAIVFTDLLINDIDADDIPFLQSGTGAISRTVQNKLQDTVSVADFGAVGDGVTDDTAAFVAAQAVPPSGFVFVPDLTYLVDESQVDLDKLWGPGEIKYQSDPSKLYAPYVSQINRLKAKGLTPEEFDTGNEIDNDGDAAIPFREMLGEGISSGITKFNTIAGTTYTFRSPDPLATGDWDDAVGVYLDNVTSDLIFDFSGSIISGVDAVRANSNAGALFTFLNADTAEGGEEVSKIEMRGLKMDLSAITAATPGVPTIGGLSAVGRWNVFLDNPIVSGGINTAAGDDVGVGGGDQAFFFSNTNSVYIKNPYIVGMPDLGVYFSNSGIKGALIEGGRIYKCKNGIGAKRFAGLVQVRGTHIVECDIGIYNPVSDGLTNNMGGRLIVSDCLFERIQSRPVDINALASGSSVRDCNFYDWGRRISDGAENSASEQISAIRVRSPVCTVKGNHFERRDFTLTTTSGKEQVGIVFGYNGDVSEGAENGSFSGNTFKDIHQRVVYEASTSGNLDRGGNVSVNIPNEDSDSGDNIYPINLTDDTKYDIIPMQNRSVYLLETQVTGSGSPNGLYYFNTSGSPATSLISAESTTNITLTAGISTVGAATDGVFTISCNSDGTVSLINRTGGTKLMRENTIKS